MNTPRSRHDFRAATAAVLAAFCLCASSMASAGLFEDEEARRAILELRQQADAQRLDSQRQADELRRAGEEDAQVSRSLLELQTQIEALRAEIAQVRGQNEVTLRELSELQRRQKDIVQAMDERLRKVEPSKVSLDGREFVAAPAEDREFEAAMASFRRGDFPASQTAFSEFIKRYPESGFRSTAMFWLGNAQYANRQYQDAMTSFRAFLAMAPDHPKAAEAALSIANCQIELKDNPAARRTLDELVKAYPQSDAATAAKERLARVR